MSNVLLEYTSFGLKHVMGAARASDTVSRATSAGIIHVASHALASDTITRATSAGKASPEELTDMTVLKMVEM